MIKRCILKLLQNKVFRLLSITILFLFTFEFLTRIFLGNSFAVADVIIPDLRLNHKWRPNLKYVDRTRRIPYTLYTNSQSWVGQSDVVISKQKNTYRIFYVGDSNVQGVVKPEKKMVEIIKEKLNQIYAKKDKRIEVINTGTSSYSPILYYLLIKNILLNYSPDLIIINVDMTDISNDAAYKKLAILDTNNLPLAVPPSSEVDRRFYRLTPQGTVKISPIEYWRTKLHGFLVENSALYYHFEKNTLPLFNSSAFYTQTDESADWMLQDWTEIIKNNVDYSMKVLGATVTLLQAKGIKVMITGVPHYPQFTGNWSVKPHEVLEETAKKHDSSYLNSYEQLKKYIANTPITAYYWKNDPTHFNEEGNALWAKIQLDFLLDPQNKLLPPMLE